MSILEDLTRKFDPILLKVNQGNTYVPIEDFLDRLNTVLGMSWSSRVTSTEFFRGPDTYSGRAQWVCTKDVEIIIRFEDADITNNRTGSGSGINFDPDTAAKTALAEATKKACNQFGIGAYLLGKDSPEREIHELHHDYLVNGEINDLKKAVAKAARVDGYTGPLDASMASFFDVKPADLQDADELDAILRSRF